MDGVSTRSSSVQAPVLEFISRPTSRWCGGATSKAVPRCGHETFQKVLVCGHASTLCVFSEIFGAPPRSAILCNPRWQCYQSHRGSSGSATKLRQKPSGKRTAESSVRALLCVTSTSRPVRTSSTHFFCMATEDTTTRRSGLREQPRVAYRVLAGIDPDPSAPSRLSTPEPRVPSRVRGTRASSAPRDPPVGRGQPQVDAQHSMRQNRPLTPSSEEDEDQDSSTEHLHSPRTSGSSQHPVPQRSVRTTEVPVQLRQTEPGRSLPLSMGRRIDGHERNDLTAVPARPPHGLFDRMRRIQRGAAPIGGLHSTREQSSGPGNYRCYLLCPADNF